MAAAMLYVLLRRKESGEWLSETAMREEKTFSESRIKAVKRRCMQLGHWKYDRYEVVRTGLLV